MRATSAIHGLDECYILRVFLGPLDRVLVVGEHRGELRLGGRLGSLEPAIQAKGARIAHAQGGLDWAKGDAPVTALASRAIDERVRIHDRN